MDKKTLSVGLIGCGTFCPAYLSTLGTVFDNVQVMACSDLYMDKAKEIAEKFQIPKACTTEELLADPQIDIALILTTPPSHYALAKQALNAGKHVYCEKPMAFSVEQANEIVELAREKGLYIAYAPDTFLTGEMQSVRKLIDDGAIGKVIGFTANFVCPGPDLWHPAGDFVYKKGGGPILDTAPYYLTNLVSVLGPIAEIFCYASKGYEVRDICGHSCDVEVLTNYTSVIKFRSGIVGNMNMSFDGWKSGLPRIEFYGTEGVVYSPDPNFLEGSLQLLRAQKLKEYVQREEGPFVRAARLYSPETDALLETVDFMWPKSGNQRGAGVADLADAIMTGRQARAGADFARHITEALNAFDISVQSGKPYVMTSTCDRPAPADL